MAGVGAAHHIYQAFGRQVRSRRNALGWTQDQLAERISLTRGSVANIEAGRQSVLLHQFLDIADALDVPPAQLLPVTDATVRQREEAEMPQVVLNALEDIKSLNTRKRARR
jgi:transcriptional regulator with XRE-family HTH domain